MSADSGSTWSDEDLGDEIIPEEWPTFYTPIPVWLLLSGCSARAYQMYAFLGEHINQREPGRRIACPKQVAIARVMGLSNDRQVAKYRRELEELGAIRVQEYRYGNGMRRGYRYVVRFNPPAGYRGLLSLKQFYAANPDVRSAGGQGRTKAAFSSGAVGSSTDRASSGSGGGAPERGSPATSERPKPRKQKAGSGEVPLTAEVLRVLEAFAPALRETMRESARTDAPKTLVTTIARELRGRSAEQLVDRVHRRWWAHGYEEKFEAGQLERPVGAAVAMVRHGECPDPGCEDGEVLESGTACVLCVERGKDYKAEQAAARRAEKEAAEAAARRVRCPACERDRGTNGAVCLVCVENLEKAVIEASEQAAADIAAVGEAPVAWSGQPEEKVFAEWSRDARGRVKAAAIEARERARGEGADEFGQLLAGRLGAQTAAHQARQIRLRAMSERDDQSGPTIPAQAPAPPSQQRVPCSGSRADGSPCGRQTDAEDGLCGLCRAHQRVEAEGVAAG